MSPIRLSSVRWIPGGDRSLRSGFDPLVPRLDPKISTWLPGEPADRWVAALEAEASRAPPLDRPKPAVRRFLARKPKLPLEEGAT